MSLFAILSYYDLNARITRSRAFATPHRLADGVVGPLLPVPVAKRGRPTLVKAMAQPPTAPETLIAIYKQMAAQAAVADIMPDMCVGLGTGTTAAFAIEALGHRVREGLSITAAASSIATQRAAQAAGIAVRDFREFARLDLAIDGVDEIDPQLRAIKGGGGALLREKIVATAAAQMVAIADDSKQVTALGAAALPIEVLPFAIGFVTARLRDLGAEVTLRQRAGREARTDQANALLDCRRLALADPEALARTLQAIPGVLAHGLFLTEIDILIVAGARGVERLAREG